jgi:hAT family C-terminal dimerisation region
LNNLTLSGDKGAELLVNSVSTFSFLFSVVVLSKLLSVTYVLSKQLQAVTIDLISVLNQVDNAVAILEKLKNTKEYNSAYNEAKVLAKKLKIKVQIQRPLRSQSKAKPKKHFQSTIYNLAIEDLIDAMQQQFLSHREEVSLLQLVLPVHSVLQFDDVRNLFDIYKDDLESGNIDVLKGEWLLWQQFWSNIDQKPKTAVETLGFFQNNLFPNIFILLQILAVLPTSTASAERSFSSLRRIKTYLRNTISQNRLNGLALMNIHQEIALEIPINQVLDVFCSTTRRLKIV